MSEKFKLHKVLIVLSVLHAAVIATGNFENKIEDELCIGRNKQIICVTPSCIHVASDILKSMDQAVNPCDDFYQFACGNYLKETKIPEDKLMVAKNVDVHETIQHQLKLLVEEPIEPNERKSFVLLKTLYQLCMDTDAIEKDGLEGLKAILQDLGGWPALKGENWREEGFHWKNLTYKLRKRGLNTNSLISISVGDDSRNLTQRTIYIDEAILPIRREFLIQGFESDLIKEYFDYLVDIAVIFGANREVALKDMRDSINFQISLAKIELAQEQRRNYTTLTNKMTIKDLNIKHPSFFWLEYVNNILSIPEILISEDEVVDVAVPTFLTDLNLLLQQTPKRVVANYIIGNVVTSLISTLTKQLRERQLRFGTAITGATKFPPRWKECTGIVSSRFSLPISALYIQKFFHDNAKKNAEEMVEDLRKAFIDMLKVVDWMDETTRAKAIEKAIHMKANVGYPQELLDNEKIDDYYEKLELSDNYLMFNLNYQKFRKEKNFRKLRDTVNKNDWKDHSQITSVNAAYFISENSIDLPAGILQSIFFNHDRPNYMNYGAIGFVIGHEITHGFDDTGRQGDKDGLLADWWSEETARTFIKKAQCFIDQYGNFTHPQLNVKLNGIITQGENIADNGGIKEAYLAYSSWVERNGEEPYLPGLNFSPKQMFWISAANIWCTKERTKFLERIVLTDGHPPAYLRIMSTFSNSRYFAEDFHCPLGSNMNPVHKCSLW